MSVEASAQKWHDQFLRTDAIDHAVAEAAVRGETGVDFAERPSSAETTGEGVRLSWPDGFSYIAG